MGTQETPEAGDEHDPHWRPRGARGKWKRQIETVEKDRRCAELASQGHSYDSIAAELGYANRSVAYRAAQRSMYTTAVEDGTTEQLRRQQIEELRQVRQRAWALVESPPPAVSRTGRIIVDDDGNPVPDATDHPRRTQHDQRRQHKSQPSQRHRGAKKVGVDHRQPGTLASRRSGQPWRSGIRPPSAPRSRKQQQN